MVIHGYYKKKKFNLTKIYSHKKKYIRRDCHIYVVYIIKKLIYPLWYYKGNI